MYLYVHRTGGADTMLKDSSGNQGHESVKNYFLALAFVGLDFFVHVHSLAPIAGSGFDSMQVNWSFVLQQPCFQNCFFLTNIQSVECSQFD